MLSHLSIIYSQLDKYYPHTAGIVFLVDGTDYNVKEIAEYDVSGNSVILIDSYMIFLFILLLLLILVLFLLL